MYSRFELCTVNDTPGLGHAMSRACAQCRCYASAGSAPRPHSLSFSLLDEVLNFFTYSPFKILHRPPKMRFLTHADYALFDDDDPREMVNRKAIEHDVFLVADMVRNLDSKNREKVLALAHQ